MEEVGIIGNLEEESRKRKERLKALKRKAIDEHSDKATRKLAQLPKPKFRSYKPTDTNLKELVLTDTKPGNVDEHVQAQLELAHNRDVIENLDLSNLAPRKPDWDLKRDAAKKLERLERRTQRAIAELIRDRLKSETDLATSVAVGAELEAVADEE